MCWGREGGRESYQGASTGACRPDDDDDGRCIMNLYYPRLRRLLRLLSILPRPSASPFLSVVRGWWGGNAGNTAPYLPSIEFFRSCCVYCVPSPPTPLPAWRTVLRTRQTFSTDYNRTTAAADHRQIFNRHRFWTLPLWKMPIKEVIN